MSDWHWNTIEPPDPLDPHDQLADPERSVRVRIYVNEEERQERRADEWLSEYGSRASDHWRHRRERD